MSRSPRVQKVLDELDKLPPAERAESVDELLGMLQRTEICRSTHAQIAALREIRNQIDHWIARFVIPVTRDHGTCCKLTVNHGKTSVFTLDISRPISNVESLERVMSEIAGAVLRDVTAMNDGTQLYEIQAHYTGDTNYIPNMLFHAAPPRFDETMPEAQIGVHESFGSDDSYYLSLDIEMHGGREACFRVKGKLESMLREICVAPVTPMNR